MDNGIFRKLRIINDLYRIALNGHKTYLPIELIHKKKFNKMQIVDMYCSCIEDVYKNSFKYLESSKNISKFDLDLSAARTIILKMKKEFKKSRRN
jgi:hypothetical protein